MIVMKLVMDPLIQQWLVVGLADDGSVYKGLLQFNETACY